MDGIQRSKFRSGYAAGLLDPLAEQGGGGETRRMELAQRRALTRHIALRLGIVVVVLGGGGLVFLQLPALTGLGRYC